MSSYRGMSGGPWDGGPPGAEADYAPRQEAAPAPYAPHAVHHAMPTTDPWTGVSYSQYAPPPNYDYSAYTASSAPGAPAYAYNYDSNYYQSPDGNYYGKYPETYPSQQSNYNYSARTRVSRSRSRSPNSRNYVRRSYRSKSRSVSPYERRERAYSRKRESSYEAERGRYRSRSRSVKSKHSRYSSSDRSSRSDRSRKTRKSKVRRSRSSASSVSQNSYRSKKTSNTRSCGRSMTPPPRKSASKKQKQSLSHISNKRSYTRSPSPIDNKGPGKSKSTKETKGKDKKQRSVTTPPPKKRNESPDKSTVTPPKNYKKSERSLTPAKSNKYKISHKSETVAKKTKENSLTPPKSYARSLSSSSSRSRSRSCSIERLKRRSFTPKMGKSRSRSSSSRSSRSRRSRSKSRRSRRQSKSKSMSKSRSPSLTKSKSTKSKPKSRSRSQSVKSRSGSLSEDERRGQFTVADRKRFWKLHRTRQEERAKGKSDRTPPKEKKPPPGAVESTRVDDVYYGDPPEVEGPNFAELLPTLPTDQDQTAQASSSKSKPMVLPIKNDGSFLEMFKKMQEQTKKTEVQKPEMKKPVLPFIGKRRGGRVLKTGLVKKAKAIDEQPAEAPKDAWSLYMQEVKKYRETSCEEERKTRPLVKYIMPEMIKSPGDLKTAPFDPRFPNQNQTRYCYQSYLDFYRCQKVRGETYEPCNYFKRVFSSLCPMDWVEKWDSQRAEGIFPGKI